MNDAAAAFENGALQALVQPRLGPPEAKQDFRRRGLVATSAPKYKMPTTGVVQARRQSDGAPLHLQGSTCATTKSAWRIADISVARVQS